MVVIVWLMKRLKDLRVGFERFEICSYQGFHFKIWLTDLNILTKRF